MRAIKQKARKVDGQCSDMWYCLIATSSPKEDGEKFLQYRSLQGPFAGGSSLQEVLNDRTGEQDVRTVQGWCSAPQGRATRRAPATGPRMGGRRGAPPTPPLPAEELPGGFELRQQGRRARRRAGTSPRHLLGLGSGRSSSMDAQDKRPHGE